MPRLLLVDDNPSIHKIAETLLATSDLDLVCASSGAEALALIDKGEPFDVGMFDISMLGMDGWELLAQVRGRQATALMPVAMMAGVLDVVDPTKLQSAPIQGFLKKPVELRDLADRVKHLLDTPVLPAPEPEPEPAPAIEPFATAPSIRLADHPGLLERIHAVPEDLLILGPEDLYPGEPTVRPTEVPSLEAETLPPEETTLDLEELDLDSLRNFTTEPEPEPEPEPAAPAVELMDFNPQDDFGDPVAASADLMAFDQPEPPAEPVAPMPALMDFLSADDFGLPEPMPREEPTQAELPEAIPDFAPGDADAEFLPAQPAAPDAPDAFNDLPDLFPIPELPLPEPAPRVEPEFDWSDDSESLLAELAAPSSPYTMPFPEAVPEPASAPTERMDPTLSSLSLDELAPEGPEDLEAPVPDPFALTESEPIALALEAAEPIAPPAPFEAEPIALDLAEPEPLPVLAAPMGLPEPPAAAPATAGVDPLAALLADPVMLDRLARAVVAHLGDQALREIAWEVIPELADRIQRN